ncbi:Ig-like domain-containing protein [Stigmatella sp. ncwal1]|uniref:Ig-like domain-containing protein n=1 Tax=Stigmatella ashevillensis TaxID=2995309 RepID=A0ABT5D815_9BACT|nr:Ig-like domain-containing protein [Stigmatella ashevillena]MDC0709814.1 Ig-like domain-containing protein [Stigmatella ashevillena]
MSTQEVVNHYAALAADAPSGSRTLRLVDLAMLPGVGRGDLLLILQVQGATLHPQAIPTPEGEVLELGSAGRYEWVEVTGVDADGQALEIRGRGPGGGLRSAYSASGHAQAVWVPQYQKLTLTPRGVLTAQDWNGSTGGVVAVAADTVQLDGTITARGKGLRGGQVRSDGATVTAEGGEGIHGGFSAPGSRSERSGRSAAANGGGRGMAPGAGGGGGANGQAPGKAWSGLGLMDVSTGDLETAWRLDPAVESSPGFFADAAGGGRGGYGCSTALEDPLATAPGNALWGCSHRADAGGLGGRPVPGDALERLFFGGGGGAGHATGASTGSGGHGGGLVFILSRKLQGAGHIEADGASGGSTWQEGHIAGPGGGGGGGTVVIMTVEDSSSIQVSASGGSGGVHHAPQDSHEGAGGGGGGGGGFVAQGGLRQAAHPVMAGGRAGSTTLPHFSTMPFNGATSGGEGVLMQLPAFGPEFPAPVFDVDLQVKLEQGEPLQPSYSTLSVHALVSNLGPDLAENAKVQIQMPENLPGQLAGCDCSCSTVGTTVECTLPRLASGDTAFIEIELTLLPGLSEPPAITATVSGGGFDASGDNNQAVLTVDFNGWVHLAGGSCASTGTHGASLGALGLLVPLLRRRRQQRRPQPSGTNCMDPRIAFLAMLLCALHVLAAPDNVLLGTGRDGGFVASSANPIIDLYVLVTAPSNGTVTNDTTPTYAGTAKLGSIVTVLVNGTPVGTTIAGAGASWTFTPTTPLPDGAYTVNATAADADGNTSPSSNANTFIVDDTAPEAPVVTTPANGSLINNATPTYSGTGEPGCTINIIVDGTSVGTTTANASGTWSFTPTVPLTDGSHTIRATATDAAGNISPSSNTNAFIVGPTAPAAPVVTTPVNGSTTNDTAPTYSGTAVPGSTVNVIVDGMPVGMAIANASGNWAFTPTAPLADGPHTVRATATDAAGNTSPSSNTNTFIVDDTAPAAPVVATPANGSLINDATPTYSGTGEPGCTINVIVDGTSVGTTTTSASGTWSFTPTVPLTDGSHTIRATATDAAGNTSPSSNTNTFIVGPTAPAAPVVTTPANGALLNDATPTITGTAEPGSTVTVIIDGTVVGTAPVDASGNWTYTPTTQLPEGVHTVSATATDAAGNTSPSSNTKTFTVDATELDTFIVSAPPLQSNSSLASFTFSSSPQGASYECTLDGAAFAPCATPLTLMGLAEGDHLLLVRARSGDGTVDGTPASHAWTVDLTPPPTPTVASPCEGEFLDSATPTFAGTAQPGSRVTLSIGCTAIGTTTTDDQGHWTLTPEPPLSEGNYLLTATASDTGGTSLSSPGRRFTVDTSHPGQGCASSGNLPSLMAMAWVLGAALRRRAARD